MAKSKAPIRKQKVKNRSKAKSKVSKKAMKKSASKKKSIPRPKKIIIDTGKLLKMEESIKFVTDVAGEKGLEIFEYLINKGEMEENKLALALKFERANAIRKYLYRLYSKGLVSYIKTRKGSKSWYTYYWSANTQRLVFLIKESYEDEIKQTKKSMELNKAEDFYVCGTCNRRYDINKALQNDFRCPYCGSVLDHLEQSQVIQDKQSRIDFLNDKIDKLLKLVKEK